MAIVRSSDAVTGDAVGGNDTDAPPFPIRSVSIAPSSSRRITADPLGAARSMRVPPVGDAIAAVATMVAGGAPVQLTLVPAPAIAASHARSTAGGTALSRKANSDGGVGSTLQPASERASI